MEYVIAQVLAIALGYKFIDYKIKKIEKKIELSNSQKIDKVYTDISSFEDRFSKKLDEKLEENNKTISKQTLRMMMPVASSVQKINSQIGL